MRAATSDGKHAVNPATQVASKMASRFARLPYRPPPSLPSEEGGSELRGGTVDRNRRIVLA
jgi:hypothetical protein